ncbi:hypothetical protein GCM10011351_25490 [Paraliobacillus quinghaiensis]|uniref:DUF488 domain-containing protein n=1 Tax=Paraliobacillus quinghaiensis TaxID=470815 RepID=A0A917TU23_9BACI|nr:DUF488 domain-containing protein [Paraliobacillus quinghaiensis]GGM38246.1 hypothetical protein GCM10011351_25490 [Paraliobacillus quinghaiensis]
MPVHLKRIYQDADKQDGVRVLVDRIWPRGMPKENAKLDYWMKEIGPSNELRKWFRHDPEKYNQFKQKYKEELEDGDQQEELEKLKDITKKHNKNVTLLFSAKDESNNQAKVLKEILDRQRL